MRTSTIAPSRPLRASLAIALLASIGSGCGPDCYDTCNKLYGSGSRDGEACGFTSPGQTTSELLDTCVDTCQSALNTPGDVGDYDPYVKQPGDAAITIETDRQAALWMDCIDETACNKLEEGYCAPVW